MMQSNNRAGLYSILFRRLEEVRQECRNEIIPFPVIFSKLCRNFTISKKECWELLFLLKEFGFIEIVVGHGVRIKINVQ